MSRLMITSDWHFGHENAYKWRPFDSAEEHDEVIFDNLATTLNKRDSLVVLGDACFTQEWLDRVDSLPCVKKTLVIGNHCSEHLHITDLVKVFDDIHGLWSKRNCWLSHCPIHPREMRRRHLNIHGHSHSNFVDDPRYFNACLENTDYKPISFEEIIERSGIPYNKKKE